jgi:hypothetical protein
MPRRYLFIRDGEERLDEVRGNSGDRRSVTPGAVICQNGGAELRYQRFGEMNCVRQTLRSGARLYGGDDEIRNRAQKTNPIGHFLSM